MGSLVTKPLAVAVGIIYPAYCSFKALETPQGEDDKQWCARVCVSACVHIAADSYVCIAVCHRGLLLLRVCACAARAWGTPRARAARYVHAHARACGGFVSR